MTLRPAVPADLERVLTLFYRSVHEVCGEAYTTAQLDAWAPKDPDRRRWGKALAGESGRRFFLAEEGTALAGFASLVSKEELFDHLYVSPDFQRQGVAAMLADHVEKLAREAGCRRIWTEASLLAKGFFARRGYRVVKEQQVERLGQKLTNFVMEKRVGG